MSDLKKLYQGSFKDRVQHFDDGGYASYDSSGNLPSDYNFPVENSGAPTAQEISNLSPNITNINGTDPITVSGPAPVPIAGDSSSSSSSGALGALLKALGLGGGQGANTAAGLAALTGLLAATGQYKQNSAYAPKFAPPPMFGGAPGTAAPTAGTSNGGYGPPGGYNYKNYANVNSGTPGLGLAPRTQTNPNIPNYYTYGQGPQAQFFSSGTPPVGTPGTAMIGAVSQGPTAMKRGGHVKKFMVGGLNTGITPNTPMAPPGTANGNMGLPPMNDMMPPKTQPLPSVAPVGMPAGIPQRPAVPRLGMPARPALPPNPVPRPVMPQRAMAQGGEANAGFVMSQQPGIESHLKLPPRTGTPGLPPMTGKPPMASGGSRHVQGPGDGTSDSIPARLANGEYVMDAQTVAMAGNGDNGAGAKALDKFRENLRKHKGGALAKGKMAPDAKDLMHYMPKGKQ